MLATSAAAGLAPGMHPVLAGLVPAGMCLLDTIDGLFMNCKWLASSSPA